jgi:hypothetical protein
MALKSIEVMCVPCKKCEGLEMKIREMVKNIEATYKTKIPCEYKFTPHLRDIGKFSLNAAQAPIIIVNGIVEFAGRVDFILLRRKLDALYKMG